MRASVRAMCGASHQMLDALKLRIEAYDHVLGSKINWPGALSLGGACSGAVLFFGNWKADALSMRVDQQSADIRRISDELKMLGEQSRSHSEQLRSNGEHLRDMHDLLTCVAEKVGVQ